MIVDEDRADHIDLNFGCPVPKVTRKGGGAALPWKRDLLRSVLRAAVGAAGQVPVTMKMRKGIDDDHLTYLDAGRIAEDEGVAAVALHGRTAAQAYSGTGRLGRGRPAQGDGDVDPGPRQRRRVGGRGRAPDDARDRVRRRRRRPRLPRPAVVVPGAGPRRSRGSRARPGPTSARWPTSCAGTPG